MAYKVYNLAGEVIETISDEVAASRKANALEDRGGDGHPAACDNWEGKGECFIYEQTTQADLLSELQAIHGSEDDGKTYIFEKQ